MKRKCCIIVDLISQSQKMVAFRTEDLLFFGDHPQLEDKAPLPPKKIEIPFWQRACLTPPAPETNALPLDQLVGRV